MVAEKLRNAILQSAMKGKLTEQLSTDGSILDFLSYSALNKVKNDEKYWEIPESWGWIKFGDLVDFKMGKTPVRSNLTFWGNDVPWISIADMNGQPIINKTKEKVSLKGFEKYFKNQLVPKGTLIMSFKLTVGRVSLLNIDALHNEAIISIYPLKHGEVQKKYLFYILPVISNFGDSKDAIKGKTLNRKSLSEILVPVPPIGEQLRIIEKLEKTFPLIDEIEYVERELKTCEEQIFPRLETSILLSAVQGTLLDKKHNPENNSVTPGKKEKPFLIPDNWSWVQLKKLGKLGMGQTVLKREMIKTGIPVYSATIGDVPLGFIKRENNKINLTKGDFVIPARGASIGHVKLIKDEEASSTQTTMYFKVDNKEFSPYLYYCLLGMKKYIFVETGTAQPQITVGVTGNQYIPLPPLDVQKEIVKKLDEIFNQL